MGLFRNQPADHLLDGADCVITVGFDAVEFDPSLWNTGASRPLVVIDALASDQDQAFLPAAELIGDIGASLAALALLLQVQVDESFRRCGDRLGPVLRAALQQSVPVLIDIPIDYSQNLKLMQDVHQDFIH